MKRGKYTYLSHPTSFSDRGENISLRAAKARMRLRDMEKALITPQYVRVKLMHYTRSFISPAPRGSQTLSLAILFCLLLLLLRAPSFSVKFMQYLFFYAPPSSPPYPSLTWGPASPLFLPFFAPLGPPSLNFDAHSHLPQNQLSSLSLATTRRPWDIFLPFLPLFPSLSVRERVLACRYF